MLHRITLTLILAAATVACRSNAGQDTDPAPSVVPDSSLAALMDDIPGHPDQLEFAALQFDPPVATEYRHELSNGVPVYLAASNEVPLITVNFSFRGGSYLEETTGVAGMTGSMLRRGGTTSMSAEKMDEELDFLAANCGSGSSSASLNCLKSNFDDAFALFLDMVKNPGFQADKLQIYKDQVLEGMKQRNDDAGDILSREWDFLMYGEQHYLGRQMTQVHLDSITEDHLRQYHAMVFQPANLIVSVTGDFEADAMLTKLEAAMQGWTLGERMPEPPPPVQTFEPGVYHVEKDIPQGKVQLGMRTVTRDDPDHHVILIMNDILGGGGFTSRITSRVRSDEGLAYSAGSRFSMPVYFPGEFNAFVQSKNRTVALAIKVILEEVESIRTDKVTDAELQTAKNTFIETFPRTFESKAGMLSVFVDDEWTGRDAAYWTEFRDKVRAVTADDVLRVAQEHLDPDGMAIMVVGKWEEMGPGDLDGRANMTEFGARTEIPIRDPLTLEGVTD